MRTYALERDIERLRSRLTSAEEDYADAEKSLEAVRADLRAAEGRVEELEAKLLTAEKAREEAEREKDEARICIQIVRERIERILAAWMRPPGGQEAGVPDKSISPQTCRELLRSLTAEQGSYTYEEWCRTTEAKAAAESRAARLEAAVKKTDLLLRFAWGFIGSIVECKDARFATALPHLTEWTEEARAALGEEGK